MGQKAIHLAAKYGHLDCVRFLVEEYPDQINTMDFNSRNPCYYAVLGNSKNSNKCLRYIIENYPDGLLDTDFYGISPVSWALRSANKGALVVMLEQDYLLKKLRNIEVLDCCVGWADDTACCDLLNKALKKMRHTFQPVEGFSKKKYHDQCAQLTCQGSRVPPLDRKSLELNLTIKRLNLDPQSRSINFLDQARALLSGLDNVGVYGFINVIKYRTNDLDGEKEGCFWSMGDVSACVQIIESLIELGARKITFLFSTSADTSVSESADHDRKDIYEKEQRIALSNLSYLLGVELKNTEGVQIIQKGDTIIEILPAHSESAKRTNSTLTMSFSEVGQQWSHCWPMSRHFISIKCYRFKSHTQCTLTDIHKDQGKQTFLNLPINSIIPTIARHDKQHSLSFPEIKAITALCTKSKEKQLHIAVIYGLHHLDLCSDYKYRILLTWLKAIHTNLNSSSDQRPVVVSIFLNTQHWDFLGRLLRNASVGLIDFRDENATTLVHNLSEGEVVLGIMPSLPRHAFDDLMLCSDYPVLAEGSNLTSFLLQHGHPHLSLLPSGNTPVAQDMGDPLEAMKAQAFSYKLNLSKLQREVLNELLNLIKEKQYKQALDYIESLKDQSCRIYESYYQLRFLWGKLNKFQHSQSAPFITIESLLKKGAEFAEKDKSLGIIGLKALKSAVDPSREAMASYLENCLDENSSTSHHFELQKMHVRQPFNHAVARGLVKFGHDKKLLR